MPSPAINQLDYAMWSPSQRRLINVATGAVLVPWQNTSSGTADVQSYRLLNKPATVVNPRRVDGTRQMSAYDTDFMGLIPARTCSYRIPLSGTPYAWEYRNCQTTSLAREGDHLGPFRAYISVIPPLDRLAADAEARTKVLSKLSQKKWDLGVTALEIKQTAGLITDGAKSFVSAFESIVRAHQSSKEVIHRFFRRVIKHGDFYQAAAEVGMKDIRLLEDIRSRWMQYQFGVKPLIYDSYDIANALADHLAKDGLSVLLRVKAGAQRRAAARYVSRMTVEPYARATLNGESTVQVHFSGVYEMPIGTTGLINELGLDNPYAILWETTRLSWMYDYWLGVGDWLSSLTAANNMTFREGCRSELLRFVTERASINDWSSNQLLYDGRYLSQGGSFERKLISPPGILPAAMPVPKSALGLTQMGNSLFALSHIAAGGRGPR